MISWAVRRPVVIWATSIGVILAGAIALVRLPLATKTTVELRRLTVSVGWRGASAEVIEMYLTSPMEAAVQTVRGVKRINSVSSEDAGAQLSVELEASADVQQVRLSILERMGMLRADFPPGSDRQATVTNYVPQDLAEAPLIRATVSGPYTRGTLHNLMKEAVGPRISAVPGVGGFQTIGGVEPGIAVTYDARLLRQLNIAPQSLSDALSVSRRSVALGGERLGPARRAVVLRDDPANIAALKDFPVLASGGRVFRIGQLASIHPEEDARGEFYRIDGNPAISISVSRLPSADAIRTARAVRQVLDEIAPTLPPGVRFRISDESLQLRDDLRGLMRRGAFAFLAVTVVLGVAFRNTRAVSLVLGSALVAICGTALGLYVLRIPANLLTISGLVMGIGILVQSGLVVAHRLRYVPDTCAGRAEASIRIRRVVVGSTLTTAVVLFPFLYLQGNARAAFVPFAAAFLLALGWSSLAALLLIPSIGNCRRMHAAPPAPQLYSRILIGLIRWRWVTLTVVGTIIAFAAWGFVRYVPRLSATSAFVDDPTILTAGIDFPRGSDIDGLDRVVSEFERVVLGQPGVSQVVARGRGTNASVQVLFTRDGAFTDTPWLLQKELIARGRLVGGARVFVQGRGPGFSVSGGTTGISAFGIRLLGFSYSGLQRAAEDIQTRLEHIPRVHEVNINVGRGPSAQEKAFAISLEPNRDVMAQYHTTAQQLAGTVAREVSGTVGGQHIRLGGEEVRLTVKAAGARERSLDELRMVIVPTRQRAPVRIANLAAVGEREVLSTVSREDQQYVRYISYEFRGPRRLALRTHDTFLSSITLPAGYSAADADASRAGADDSARGLWLVFAIGVALVFLAVAIVFDSAWVAGMVLSNLPLALAGVMTAFWIAHATFTREAAVGVILVVGLTVHQTILMLDAVLERRRRAPVDTAPRAESGLKPIAAIRAAAECSRLVFLVTLTTLASLIPLVVGTDGRTVFGAIALASTGGTIAGAVGAMFVLPALMVERR